MDWGEWFPHRRQLGEDEQRETLPGDPEPEKEALERRISAISLLAIARAGLMAIEAAHIGVRSLVGISFLNWKNLVITISA